MGELKLAMEKQRQLVLQKLEKLKDCKALDAQAQQQRVVEQQQHVVAQQQRVEPARDLTRRFRAKVVRDKAESNLDYPLLKVNHEETVAKMFLYMEDAERAAFVKKLRERAAQLPITPEHNQLSNITLAFLEFC